jgi:hypothetical protein
MAKHRVTMTINSRLHAGARAMPAVLALAAFAAAPAAAAAPGAPAAPSPQTVAFALSPVGGGSSIRMRSAAGRLLRGAVLIRNLSTHEVTVILQRADIQNASNGNADYVTTRLAATGRWLRLSAARVHLAPLTTLRVTYTVTIPADAVGGSHYAGIVAINAADLATPAVRGRSHGRTFTFFRINRQALPLTVRLPGHLSRGLSLRSASVSVQPIGAELLLGLRPVGDELTQDAPVKLRILRGARTIFTYASALGQLFPGSSLNFRIPWHGIPTPGAYHLIGTIRPAGAPVIYINRTIEFTSHGAARLKRVTPPAAQRPAAGMPGWVWVVLAFAAAMLLGLSVAVWKLSRRSRPAMA